VQVEPPQTTQTAEEIVREIHAAFDDVPVPSRIDDMLMPLYRGNDEAYELAADFAGKPWQEMPLPRLMYHREFLGSMSAAGYRAVLPAYLVGSVVTGPEADHCRGDIFGYMLMTLKAWPHQNEVHRVLAPERLSGLDPAQRAVVANVLRYLVEFWGSKEAAEILRDW
jgi:hypothetical protein